MARKSRKNAWKVVGIAVCLLTMAVLGWFFWRWREEALRTPPDQNLNRGPGPSGFIPPSPILRRPSSPEPSSSNRVPLTVAEPHLDGIPNPPRGNEAVPGVTNPPVVSPSSVPETRVSLPGPPPIPEVWLTEIPPVTNILLAQIALSGHAISVGSIDGTGGFQTATALQAYQSDHGLEQTGRLDLPTQQSLQLRHPPFTRRVATHEELARLRPLPGTWLGKAGVERLEFGTWLELLGEAVRSQPAALSRWNPGVDWNRIRSGDGALVPISDYPPARRATLVRLSLTGHWIRAFGDQGNLLAHFPCSIGRIAEKRPVGLLHVVSVVKEPNYTFNPEVFPESPEAQSVGRKLLLPPGPNNPVGVAWIGLDRPGYGIHGTPSPEQVGRTESHGCFRLANWNADYLRQMVRAGTPVMIEP